MEGRFPKGQNEGLLLSGPRQSRVISGSVLAKTVVPPQVMPVWERAPLLDLKLVIVEVWVGSVHQKGFYVCIRHGTQLVTLLSWIDSCDR